MRSVREPVRLTGVAVGMVTLVVGAAAATGYVVDVHTERDELRAQVQAGRPTPPAPVTVTPAPTRPGRTASSSDTTRLVQPVSGHTARPDRAGATGRGDDDGGGGPAPPAPPQAPPAEPGTPPAKRCPDGSLITVRVSLGLLPCDAIQIGGNE